MTSPEPSPLLSLSKLPHILLIVTDQFRHDAFSSQTTPNLYDLARTSTHFRNAYASTPTCTPSRAGLLTGKSPWNHGMLGYNAYVDCTKYATTLPSVLADMLGYDTYAVGKNHFGVRPNRDDDDDGGGGGYSFVDHGYRHMSLYEGLNADVLDDYQRFFNETYPGMDPLATCDLGWNEWRSCPYYYEEFAHPTNWTTRQAIRFLEQFNFTDDDDDDDDDEHVAPRRMFLKVSYHRPHSPYDPPRRLFDKHTRRIPPVDRYVNNTSWDAQFLNTTTEMSRSAWFGDPGVDAARRSRAGYLASVEHVDGAIGTVLDWMRNRRFQGGGGTLEDRFLIVHTSDHGDMNGDHNLWRKGYPYEAASRVHMTIKLPRGRGGSAAATTTATTSDAIVENRDIAVTLYDYLGVLDRVKEIDPLVNGRSLLGILRGYGGNNDRTEISDSTTSLSSSSSSLSSVRSWLDLEHSAVYSKRIHWNAIVGTLDGYLYKYIYHAYDGTEQLFNLSLDPNESHDLARAHVNDANYDIYDNKVGDVVAYWRETLIRQFQQEGRGEHWLKDGRLVVRGESSVTLGDLYPCKGTTTRTGRSSLSNPAASVYRRG